MNRLIGMGTLALLACGQPAPLLDGTDGGRANANAVTAPATRGVRYTDERLTVDGEPFFPYGVIWRASGVPLQTYRDYHLNIFLTSGKPEEVAEAARLGLKTFAVGRSKAAVAAHHGNPTLVAWFVADDAKSEQHVVEIGEAVAAIRSRDPHRPVFANLIGHTVERNAPFVDLLDVPAPYRYPFPTRTLQWYREYLGTLHEGNQRRAYWTVVQSSGIYSKHRQELGIADGDMRRFLSPAQLRLLIWTNLQLGCRGMFFWPDYGLFDGSDFARARALEVARVGLELEVFADLLVLGDPVDDVGVRSGSGPVRATAVRHGAAVLVLVADDPANAHEWVEVRSGGPSFVEIPDGSLPAGSLRAFRLGFPGMEPAAVTRDGEGARLEVSDLDVAGAWLVTTGDGEPWASRIAGRADEYVRLVAESVRVETEAGRRVIDHLAALGYIDDVPRFQHVLDKSSATARGMMDLRRDWRRVTTGLQAHAKSRRYRAAPGAENLWMSVYTLPAFYGSLTDSVER